MAKLLKLRRGSTSQHSSFTGAEGEVTIDTTKDTAVVHDGTQAGGRPLAREDMSNVSSASIAGQLGTDSISVDKIAAGTLPNDVKVTGANITNQEITNVDVSNTAAIAGTKISPDFGSQNVVTTGTLGSGNITISNNAPSLFFTEGDANPDYQLLSNGGQFRIYDVTNTTNRIVVNTDGHVDIPGNLDCGAGLDVTGNVSCDGIRMTDGDEIRLGNSDDLKIFHDGNNSIIREQGAGHLYFQNGTSNILSIDSAGANVTGNITVTGTVDGRDVASDGSKLDTYEANGSSYVRSDVDDTVSGNLQFSDQQNFNGTGTYPVVIGNTSGDNGAKLLIRGAASPYIEFRENNTNKAELQWHSDGFFRIINLEDNAQLRIKDDITFSLDGSTHNKVWHAGNDGSGSGLDADTLDGVQGSSFVRSDASDVLTGQYDFQNTGSYPIVIGNTSGSANAHLLLRGSDNPYMRFREQNTDKAYIQWNSGGYLEMYNEETSRSIRIKSGSSAFIANIGGTEHAIWHGGNDGSGSGLDADTVDGVQGSSFVRSDASDTFTGTLTMGTQQALVANNYGRGVYGLYASTKYQHVWSMGTAYNISDDGSGYGNMYGLTYTHTNVGTGSNESISGLSHQLQHRTNGTLTAAIGTGIWTSGNVTAYSDIAVKRNLVKIPNALEKVSLINGYTYERTDHVQDPEDPESPEILRQAGVVAQEVEKVLPEVVSGQEGNKAVAYGNMVALLIEAVKELKAEVEELKGGK